MKMQRKRGRPKAPVRMIPVKVTVSPADCETARKLNLNLSELLRNAIESQERAVQKTKGRMEPKSKKSIGKEIEAGC